MDKELSPDALADARVDEASLESMDCSDPPTYGGLTAGAPPKAAVAPRTRQSRNRKSRSLRAGALFLGGMAALAYLATRPKRERRSRLPPVVQNALVGLAATQALDWLSIALYEGQDPKATEVEDRARGNHHAYEVAVDRMARAVGIQLGEAGIRRWGYGFHKVFGTLGAAGYAAARRHASKLGAGAGTLYGTAFFLIADELLMPALRLTPGPGAFPLKTHARGAASHVAYGVAAELATRALGI